MRAEERHKRRQRQLHLRASLGLPLYGVSYGIGAYGSPIGNVTGVGDHDADDVMGPQFNDHDADDAPPAPAGGSGDGGSGAAAGGAP